MAYAQKKFVFLPHTADIKFRAFGKDLEEVFGNAALAMTAAMTEEKVKKKVTKKVSVTGRDKENLLLNFLNELIFLFDTEQFLIADVKKIKIKGENEDLWLNAEVAGDNTGKYALKIYVKAATYNQMLVQKDKKTKQWIVDVVLDV